MRLSLVLLIAFSVTIPVLQEAAAQKRYRLDASTLALVGGTNANLSRKITYDSQKDMWQFNASAIKKADDPVGDLKAQLGGGGKKDSSLYSVDLPADSSKGVTYYDANTQLSFTLIPQFRVKIGRESNGRLVYPIDGGKMIYTAKNNGMKEDIVLNKNIGNNLEFVYDLNLPDTLQAKLLDDGSVGIYSADLALYGNINFGTDTDRAKVESARKNADKDTLVFVLPPPVIKGRGNSGKATGMFRLEDGKLVVYANNMDSLTYPATVDPSVVITSSSDFSKGNNEGNIDYPSGQINRGAVTGGSLTGAWSNGTNLAVGRDGHGTVAYNGYMYVLGGWNGSTRRNDVVYAPISTNGSLGSWSTTTSFTTGRAYFSAVAYNGFMYVLGGQTGASAFTNNVQYAPINADGTVGTWTATSSFTNGRGDMKVATYNGYIYLTGGDNATTEYGDVQYASVNANGVLGTWGSTTSLTGTRDGHGFFIFNNYAYVMGGVNTMGTGSMYSDAYYAPVKADGTIGTWTATTNMTAARSDFALVYNNGYVYVMGGFNGSTSIATVEYAPVYANGTLGSWTATTSLTTVRVGNAAVAYNGYVYSTGGSVGSVVYYHAIDAAGTTTAYSAGTNLTNSRYGVVATAYNGYLYVLGGKTSSGGGWTTTVNYAPLSTNGSVGTWATTTAFTTARSQFYGVAYNGYMYVCGGNTGSGVYTNTCYYSAIAGDGTLGTWTSTSGFINARMWFGGAIYRGYMYIAGGHGTAQYNDVQYAVINSTGTLGAWHYTHNSTDDSTTFVSGFTNIRESLAVVAAGGYLYVIGGWQDTGGSGTYYNDVQYAPLNTNGTVGTWGTTTSFTTAREDHSAEVINGYVYIADGQGSSGWLGDVQYAPIKADGTLGTWNTTTTFATSRSDFGMVYHRGYLYAVAGQDSGSGTLNSIQYAAVNNGGNGTLGTWNTSANSLITARSGHGTVAYNGYLYVLGGYSGTTSLYTVEYAQINGDGSIGAWAATSSFTTARQYMGYTTYNGYMYILGGWNGTTDYSDVQYASINSDGTLGTWTATTSFTTARDGLAAVANNGYMYILGGYGGGERSDVQYAPINSDGTLGTWTATTSFTTGRDGLTALANGNYMYIFGGFGIAAMNDVQYAPINSDGTIGTWVTTNRFAGARYYHATTVRNGYMYIMGGKIASTTYTNDVQYAPINANGTLGTWTHANSFTTARYGSSTAIYNGTLYFVGGTNASPQSDTQYVQLNILARKGAYSKLLTLSGEYSLGSITYGGTIPNAIANITVETASSNGVLGAAQSTSGLTTPAACTAGTTKYVWLRVFFDDTTSSAFPDSVVTPANATDITVNIVVKHPDPSVRLHGGKFFEQEVLQPLDTCGP